MRCFGVFQRLAIAGFAVMAISACSTTAVTKQWSEQPDMPTGRQEIYAASDGGLIYVPGGILRDMVTTSAAFEALDTKQNKWITLAPLPAPRHHITPAIIDDEIYAVGGFDGPYPAWEIKSEMFVYNLKTGVWREGAPLTEPRGEHVAVVLANKIHVIGGRVAKEGGKSHFDAYVDTNTHTIYDPKTGQWSAGASAPIARNSAAAAAIDGLIYVVGGRENVLQDDGTQLQQNVGTLEVYDARADTWETLAPMPEALGGIAAATSRGKLYVLGGEQWAPEKKVFSSVWVYEPKTNAWSKESSLLTARHGLAAGSADGVVYSIGGCTEVGGGAAVGTTEALISSPVK